MAPVLSGPTVIAEGDELCFASACAAGVGHPISKLSAREVMEASPRSHRPSNPQLNAIVAKLDDEACVKKADEAD